MELARLSALLSRAKMALNLKKATAAQAACADSGQDVRHALNATEKVIRPSCPLTSRCRRDPFVADHDDGF